MSLGNKFSHRPTRIVLNFAHRCNMSCEWCYVPFAGDRPDPAVCKRIIQRSAEIGFEVFTFGGGDPLLYEFLPDLIASARRRSLFVHVDTNGIGLQCTDATVSLLTDGIDLLGLPLDGPRSDIHDRMRSTISHFELVLDRLAWLRPFMSMVKINTFVSKCNANTIPEMVPLIARLGPSRWSLYQYWPLSHGKAAMPRHIISDEQFSTTTGRLPATIDRVRVEINPVPVRRLTYPFVSHDGTVYKHDQRDESSYEILGPIFDDAVITELFARCGTEREEAKSRYASPRRLGEEEVEARPVQF
jgi:MoaA/NifB/PqqE/SkfB family radical SAM enzyme